ncbi:hypothetical protein ABW21_db0200090 [Orbilia brochopaga]|nr:hypothetical protein ABW21_db0200090 [Drechslerella brochopaga]
MKYSTMSDSNVHWRETAPGLWVRDFSPVEKFLHFVAVASPHWNQWIVQSGVTLPTDLDLTLDKIKDAWLALRCIHPLIGCTITDTGFQYQVQDRAQLLKWVDATAKVDQSGKSGQDLALTVKSPNSSELYFLPDTREVFIQTRHEMIDGVGCMMLLNNLIRIIREGSSPALALDPENQIARLSPAVTQLMRAENPSPEILEGPQQYMESYSCEEQIGLKLRSDIDLNAAPEPRRCKHEFSEAETAAILKACKERNITVTHAATAASSRAILDQSEQESGYLRSPFCINVREFLPQPYNSQEYAVAAYFTTGLPNIPVSSSGDIDNLKLANDIKTFYNTEKYDPNIIAHSAAYLEGLEDAVKMAAANDIPANFTIVTSWGLADRYITEPCEDFWGNVSVATPTTGLLVYTAKGRLQLVLVYSSTYYEDESMQGYVDGTVRHLRSSLGLVV